MPRWATGSGPHGSAGRIINAPVCMTLPLGNGKIQFQTFHIDKQSSSLAKPLMEYLLTDGAGLPHINSISPTKGSVGTTVTITGMNFGASKVSDSYVTFNSQTVGTYKSWSASQIQVLVPNGASSGLVRVYTKGGTSNGVGFTLTTGPSTPSVWYLAEGTSDWGFDTFVTIENHGKAASSRVGICSENPPESGRISWRMRPDRISIVSICSKASQEGRPLKRRCIRLSQSSL